MEPGACAPGSIRGVIKGYERHGHDREMITMIGTTLTLETRTDAHGTTEYLYETEDFRFVVRRDRTPRTWWVWEVQAWTLKTEVFAGNTKKVQDCLLETWGRMDLRPDVWEEIEDYLRNLANHR